MHPKRQRNFQVFYIIYKDTCKNLTCIREIQRFLFSEGEEDLLALEMRVVSFILLAMPEVYLLSVTIKPVIMSWGRGRK